MTEKRTIYKLDDSVIAKIVQIIQIGFLTGTDVVDHMRLILVEPKLSKLVLTPEYIEQEGKNMDQMFDKLEEMISKDDKTE